MSTGGRQTPSVRYFHDDDLREWNQKAGRSAGTEAQQAVPLQSPMIQADPISIDETHIDTRLRVPLRNFA